MPNELHQKVFEFMESYRSSNPNFVYWLRTQNRNNRLDEGVWFQGTENYAFVGLYDRGGGTNMTRSIGLVFYPKDDKIACEFENVFNEEADDKILKFYDELRSLIGNFNQIGKTKYKKLISIEDGFAGAKIFLDTIKPQIDNLVKKHGLDDLFIKTDKFKKSIDAIMARQNSEQVDSKSMFKSLLVNLTWNSSDWQDVSDDKSGHKWVKAGNTPHESWNFDFENTRNTVEYIKGFAQFTNPPKVQGANNLIIFVSQNQIVGFYGKTEVLEVPEEINDHESYNLVAHKDISLVLKNKITDIKKKGYLETKEKIGQIGFCYIEKLETLQKIIQEAITLNPEESNKLNNLLRWVESECQPENKIIMKRTMPLNQILYGPPGTGKTYNTIDKAIKIIDSDFDLSQRREHIKQKYEKLVKSEQIVFTTFHQSLSYEDFIEGIKPLEPKTEGAPPSYKVQNGIFKEIAKKAKENIELSSIKDSPKDKKPFDSVFNILLQKVESALLDDPVTIENNMQRGLVIKLASSFFCITGINGSSIRMMTRTGNEQNTMTKSTLRTIYEDSDNLDKYIVGGMRTYYRALVDELAKWEAEVEVISKSVEAKNYVIIIDEINRGNVSQIFGELITLIEEDKRLGNAEALEVTLPYSKEKFGVPSNLYIIGTMNTADRSVEALDTALRRRFSFEEMQPKPELIKTHGYAIDGMVEDIDLVRVLKTINKRIEVLLDKDHQIGHSYFMCVNNIEDLKSAFKNKIIPLLQEYFFGDYGKIGLVLGSGFVSVEKNIDSKKLFASFDDSYDAADLAERTIYNIVDVEDTGFDIQAAIKSLLN
jgi:hypothetical protein